ncbi:hypothetical protein ADUPG1_009081 [Aduncisulcus paluster]|uniref:Uncharacterized protein n=1 Tax=Aduncisulcus paluster TaxID=2918883 RepID=A0ABQ5KVJ7_9EUKA|nr:hypothetical protein ADUPG1_009081 [Aduncisulcus paluster]
MPGENPNYRSPLSIDGRRILLEEKFTKDSSGRDYTDPSDIMTQIMTQSKVSNPEFCHILAVETIEDCHDRRFSDDTVEAYKNLLALPINFELGNKGINSFHKRVEHLLKLAKSSTIAKIDAYIASIRDDGFSWYDISDRLEDIDQIIQLFRAPERGVKKNRICKDIKEKSKEKKKYGAADSIWKGFPVCTRRDKATEKFQECTMTERGTRWLLPITYKILLRIIRKAKERVCKCKEAKERVCKCKEAKEIEACEKELSALEVTLKKK